MKSLVFAAVLAAMSFASVVSAHAECKSEATIAQLLTASAEGEKAFAQMDLTALLKHASLAREELVPCIKRPLTPKQAAAFHRLMALEAFTRHSYKRVIAEFHAARMLEPGYAIPSEVADGDHPLLTHYEEAAKAPDGDAQAITAPAAGHVFVGGVRNAPRRKLTPAVIQVYSGATEDTWIETKYIQPGETLPIWGPNAFGLTAKDLGIDTQPGWQKPAPWYISAGVSAAIAAVFYGLAMHEKSQFEDRGTPDGDLKGHRDRANGFGATAATTAGLAVIFTGLGVGFQFGFGGPDAPSVQPTFIAPPPFERPFVLGGIHE